MEAFAKDLSTQFVCNLGGAFAEAIRSFSLATPDATEAQLPEFERRILGPLTRLKPGTSVRIVLDGLDSLATKARTELLRFLNKLLDDPLLARVRLVVTASSEQELPNGAKIIRAPEQAERETLERYLLKRNCSEQDVPFILDQSQGNWLVAKFLANKASCAAEGITCIAVQRNLDQFWDHMLEDRQVGAAPRLAKEPMAQIVCILAAAGRGPLLPVCLLLETSRRLGAVGDMKDLRDYLARLNDILVRVSPGTSEERVGLFHSRLVEFVVDKKYKKSVAASRDVIIQVLEEHAGETEAVKRFAIEHEPDLFLAQNRPEEALASVRHWDGEIRRRGENLNRWRAWKDSFAEKLTDRHPCTLSVRAELAERLGKCGQEKRAWTELNEVLKLQISAYGDDRHFEALKTRHYLTHWIGPSVGSEHALSHALRLLPDEFMALGANARDVFKTRHNIAYWEGQSGDRRKAREDFKNLLRDEERDPSQGLGKTDPDTLRTRHGFAFWTGICGNAKEALRLFQELLADQEATQGAEDVETLKTRDNVAHWTGHVGKHEEACKLYESLLPLRKRVLGSDDPDTLRTRRSIAFWKGRSGRVLEALQESLDLLEDLRSSPIEHTHEDTLRTLEHVALWTGITGSPSEALTLADGVRKSWEQKRCADHPDLFFVRHLIAYLQMARGNAKEAFEEAERLLADMKRDYCELAERHPDTMLLRHNIARWVGQTGDPCRATELLKAVADDREKVLGGEHPDTLETKYYVMFWQMQCVDSKNTLDEAARMRDLLAQQDTSLNLGPYAPLKIRLRVFLESLERFGATSKGSSP
jgi:tetratricopeptide (TPR) repeat protein